MEEDLENEELVNEQEQSLPEVEEVKPKWQWIGDTERPEAAETEDGISDLFEVNDENDTDDLLRVDVEKDVLDANPETGGLDDLTEVSETDIMGDEDNQVPLYYKPDKPRQRFRRIQRIARRETPDTSMGGMRY